MDITEFSTDFFSLKGKRAIVTGGNSGLGRAFVVALAAAGADVFVPSLDDDDGTTARLVDERGGRYEFLQADITQDGVPAQVVATCVDRLGGVDILINSAGICLLDDVIAFDRS
jgi:NAD(P)-dependent dehydrogenase (short-subunit alcohol dehydrogenase family)